MDRAVQGKTTLLSLIKGAVAEDDGKDAVERFPANLGLVQIQDNRYRNEYRSENGFNFIGVTEFDKINLDDLIGVNDFNATNHQADLHYLGTIFAAGRDTSARGQQRGGVDVFAKDEGGTITYNRLIEEPQPSILQRLVKGLIEHAGGIVSGVVESGKNLFKLWDLIKGLATKIRSAVPQIITAVRENPEGFIRNLVTGVAGGFEKFLKNLGGNLTDSVIQWVTDNLKLPSIELPKEFNVEGIVTFLMQFFGLTPDNILNIVVNKIGPQNVALITKAYGFISKAVENPQSVIDLLKDNLFALSPEALVKKGLESAASYVGTYVAAKAAQEVAGIFTGGAIFTKIYNALDFVVNKGHQLVAVVDKVVDGLLALAQGQTGGLSDEVEAGLKLGIKPLLSLVASALGVPKLADQVGGAIGKVSGFVTEKLDKYIGLLVDKAKGLLGLGGSNSQNAAPQDLVAKRDFTIASKHYAIGASLTGPKGEVYIGDPVSFGELLKNWGFTISSLTNDPKKTQLQQNLKAAADLFQKLQEALAKVKEASRKLTPKPPVPKAGEIGLAAQQSAMGKPQELNNFKAMVKEQAEVQELIDQLEGLVKQILPAVGGVTGSTIPPAGQRGIWDISSDRDRGEAAENRLGGRTGLPFEFPVIDRFQNGVATSVKTINLGETTYQSPSAIVSTARTYIDEVATFAVSAPVTYGPKSIRPSQVTQRAIDIVVPPWHSPAQWQALQTLLAYGAGLNKPVLVRIVELQ